MTRFRLNYQAYKDAEAATETMKNFFDSHIYEMSQTNTNLRENWAGKRATFAVETMNTELTTGNYDKAYKYATNTDTILDNYHLIIDRLGATREEIGKNLHSDEPVDVDTITHVEPDLIFNYDVVPALDAAADTAVENGLNMAETIQQMINMAKGVASEYLDFTTEQEQLEEGIKKIKRVQNYKEAFDKFAKDMSDFETNMSMDLAAKMKEIGDTYAANKLFKNIEVSKNNREIRQLEDGAFLDSFIQNNKIISIIIEFMFKYVERITDILNDFDSYQKEQNYELLSEELKQYVTVDDIIVSGDGYIMLTKPVADILEEMNIMDTNVSKLNENDVQSYYDDWYIYGIKDDKGNITYSLLKMREKENDSKMGDADGDAPEVAISFVEFDINKLIVLRDEQTNKEKDELTNEIDRVIKSKNQKHNTILQEYFSDTESKAPYIIADVYIEKVAKTAKNNRLELPDNFDEAPSRISEALEKINEDAGYLIYDKENKCLNIEDINKLSKEEKYAILTVYTSNVTYNSFAAEVEFHSDALIDWKANIPYFGKKKWYESAIRANMGFGEEKESNVGGGFDEYYDLDSEIVKKQAEIHGER